MGSVAETHACVEYACSMTGAHSGSLWLDPDAVDTPEPTAASAPAVATQPPSGGEATAGAPSSQSQRTHAQHGASTSTSSSTASASASAAHKAPSKAKKARLARLHEKKAKGKQGPTMEEMEAELHAHERRYAETEDVGFGEVAMQPPSLTLKRKRGVDSTGGEMLEPASKGKKLGAMMARQMQAAQAAAALAAAAKGPRSAAPKQTVAAERVRQNIIEQYRLKRQRMPQLPSGAAERLAAATPYPANE